MYVIKYKANKGIVVVVVVRKLHSGFFFFARLRLKDVSFHEKKNSQNSG